jgi:hypothetical protein
MGRWEKFRFIKLNWNYSNRRKLQAGSKIFSFLEIRVDWEMGDGRWEMGDGRWEMGDGRWRWRW